jgi:multisubunit Na+/H+ antiporter MnhB subunit
MSISIFATVIGTLGVILMLVAYIMLQIERINPYSIRYSLMNCIGSVMLLYSLYYDWNTPAVLIETVWGAISAYGIYRALMSRSKTNPEEMTTSSVSP